MSTPLVPLPSRGRAVPVVLHGSRLRLPPGLLALGTLG
ncbi:hypothetical protein EV189_0443 [Motilibacter rhizosphaerae]|uniref:Uncharacterized protein n=1 Tax=Motilibacter rhizosphaerae TaxID=598652 RepID=A0A4V2F512_9ACTN|nr:hypothetical protein EV189_0443 [Motilibacter rhizosphaerae]